MNNPRLDHEEVKKVVVKHFTQLGFKAEKERDIQIGAGKGRNHGIADVVVRNAEGYWVAIVECKQERINPSLEGEDQLKSYLSATDTRFGIIAASRDPADWIYFENLRSNVFMKRERAYFNAHINDPPFVDRPDYDAINQLKLDKEQLETHNDQLTNDKSQLEDDKEQLETHNKQLETYNNNLKRQIKFRTIVSFCSALIIASCLSVYFLILLPKHSDTRYEIVRIIDGDTVEIQYEGKLTKVHFVGIDAPEPNTTNNQPPEPYSEEATKYLQDFLLDEAIYLRFDENKWDPHERLLGYVYRASDGIFVNLEMIREGYAEVDLRYPFKYEDLFTDYEFRAKKDRKGLWGGYR